MSLKAIMGFVLLQKTGGCSGKAAYLFIGSSLAQVGLPSREFVSLNLGVDTWIIRREVAVELLIYFCKPFVCAHEY